MAASDDTKDGIKGLARASVIYGLGSMALRGATFLLLPLYTRHLTPADYGVIALAATLTAALGILYPLGLHGAITRFYFAIPYREARQQNLGNIWMVMVMSTLGMTILLDQFGARLSSLFLRDIPFPPYIRLAIWTACCNILSLLPLNLLQIQKRPGLYVLMTAANTLLSNGLAIGLVVFYGQGAYGYLLSLFLTSALLALPYVVYTLCSVRLLLRWSIIKATLIYSLPLVPHGLAGWLLELSDRIILERYVSLREVGLYALGYQFASLVTMVATAMNTAWVPFLFSTDAQQGTTHTPDLARLVTYYTLVLCWVALGLALFAQEALRWLTAPAFHEAYRVVPWVIGGLLFGGLYFIPANFLFLRSKTGWIPLVTLASGGVNVGLNLWLVPRYGMLGAAWTTCIAYAVMLVLVWAVSQRVYPLTYEYKRLGAIALAASSLFIVSRLYTFPTALTAALGHGVIWLLFPVVLSMCGFFTATEKALALARAQRIRGRIGRRASHPSS